MTRIADTGLHEFIPRLLFLEELIRGQASPPSLLVEPDHIVRGCGVGRYAVTTRSKCFPEEHILPEIPDLLLDEPLSIRCRPIDLVLFS